MATLQEEFIALVNAKNPGMGLTLDDVDFSNPVAYTPSESGDTRNSALVLTAKVTSPTFRGSKEYHFFRFDFTHPSGEDAWSLGTEDVMSNYDNDQYALDIFNMMLPNHHLTLDDITVVRTGPVTDADGTHLDVKVVVDPNHLKWHGAYVIRCLSGKDNLFWKSGELGEFS